MAAQVIPFTFQQQHSIRTTLIEDEPWFCLADVCAVLSVDRTSDLLRNLDAKGVVKNPTLTQGVEQQLKFVNEPNLYRVIFRSNKPEAKTFQDWVFNEVLPTLRRQGRYKTPGAHAEPFIGLFHFSPVINSSAPPTSADATWIASMAARP